MTCGGCGNQSAVAVRLTYEAGQRIEMCDLPSCGGVTVSAKRDVYFRQPYVDQNLADAKNPFGTEIRSARHKAQVLKAQGLREDGDRHHGSLFRDAKAPKRALSMEFRKKVRARVNHVVKRMSRGNAV